LPDLHASHGYDQAGDGADYRSAAGLQFPDFLIAGRVAQFAHQ
jgi:hypothetical protein